MGIVVDIMTLMVYVCFCVCLNENLPGTMMRSVDVELNPVRLDLSEIVLPTLMS